MTLQIQRDSLLFVCLAHLVSDGECCCRGSSGSYDDRQTGQIVTVGVVLAVFVVIVAVLISVVTLGCGGLVCNLVPMSDNFWYATRKHTAAMVST